MTTPNPATSCPQCGSTSVEAVPVKRSTVPKALAAEYLATTPSAAAASETIIQNVCPMCGCRWVPRTKQERHLRALSGQLGQEAMRAAQAQEAAESEKARQSAVAKIPVRTWIIAAVLAIVALLALFT